MTNYLLRNLNVSLKSSDQNTSTFELIVEFDTLHYGVKLALDETIEGQIKLTYEIDQKLKTDKLYHNGFFYLKNLNWNPDKLLNIIVVVDYLEEPEEIEACSVMKSEKDVIKPSGGAEG